MRVVTVHAYCSSVDARSSQNKFLVQMSFIFHPNSYELTSWIMHTMQALLAGVCLQRYVNFCNKHADLEMIHLHVLYFFPLIHRQYIQVYSSYAPSNPESRVAFPTRSGFLISFLGLDVCPLCCLWRWSWRCTEHIQGGPTLCYVTSVLLHNLCLLYRHLTNGQLSCKPGGVSPILDESGYQTKKEEK